MGGGGVTYADDTTYPLYVGETQVTDSTLNGTDANGGTWQYDPGTNTLKLTNYTYEGAGHEGAAIYYNGTAPLVIELSGANTIQQTGDSSGNSDHSYGIQIHNSGGSLIISSDTNGTLNVSGGQATGVVGLSAGIHADGSVFVGDNATVTATGGQATGEGGQSYGISGTTVSVGGNATVTATGGTATMNSIGIYASGTVSVGGSAKVTATGGQATGESYGIGGTTVSVGGNAIVTATGGQATGGSYGIVGTTVSVGGNAIVTATGGQATDERGRSCGIVVRIYDNGTLSVGDSATLTATGGQATGESYGIYGTTVSVGDSATLTATGDNQAVMGNVINAFRGRGWTNTAGTEGEARIEISTDGQDLSAYQKVEFPYFTVSFDVNGGSPVNSADVRGGDKVTKPTDPARTGYDFGQWYKESSFTNAWDFGSEKVSADMTLYARWIPVTYSISYELNGGTNDTANPVSYDIESVTITLKDPTKTGYDFVNWTSGDTAVTSIPNGSTGNRVFTAHWTPTGYDITYTLNGGTNDAANPAKYTIESATITLKAPTREHYEFVSWTPEGVIDAGSTENKTFTANWKPVTYSISYNLNGADNPGNPASYTVESNAITLNNPKRNGYNFDGWTGTDLNAKTQAVTIAKGSAGNRSYTANFTPIKYKITYNLDDGTNNPDNPVEYTVESETITLKAPTKDGHKFTGWTPEGVINHGSTGDKTFTANWNLITYSISYDLDGGTVATANPTSYTIESNAITLNNPTKTGYNFTGWTGSNGTTPQTSVTIAKGSTGDKSFKANFIIPVSEDVKTDSDDIKTDDTKSEDKTVKEIEQILNTVSGDETQTLTQEQVDKVLKDVAALSGDLKLTPEETNTLAKIVLSADKSNLSTEQVEAIVENVAQNIASNDDGIDKEAMKTLTDSLVTKDTATGETTLTAEALTDTNSIAAKIAVQALASSVENSETKELKLESVPLISLNGINKLLEKVVEESSGTASTSELTLDLGGMKELKTVDNLEGVSLKEIKLENNISVTDVKLDGATVQNVDIKGSKVQKLSLNTDSNVKEINASGAKELTSLDLAGNKNIQTLNISETNVAELNAAGCENLENLTAEGGSEGAGNLESINLEGCVKLEKLSVPNNKLLGLKKPSGFPKPGNFSFKARGQRRTSDTKFSAGMNLFKFIVSLSKSVLSTADADTTSNDLPFDIGDIVSVKVDGNEASFDSDGNLSATPTKSLSYELDPFGLSKNKSVDGGSINTADDDNNDNVMDVTIESSSENGDGGANGSGGGCDLVRSEELGVRSVLVLALFLLGLMELAPIKFRRS